MIPPLLLNVEPHHKVVYQTEDGRGGERRYLSVPLAFSSCVCLIMLCILRFCFCSFVFFLTVHIATQKLLHC